ncbi:hypothetical protein GN244_ATG01561 [Phytophthora infestans]|uniref:Elicitin-like protein n=1 Tax=Phytophthora infestans TaxID=4787 RepID=A0A833SCY0_PHYIN|nr:hypothetical protein GN244_ATG01561 [Phytophthora infestans]KAF4134959.1 hypothetical protein GN958_ATG15857 [Phytophthora infestans]KAF4142009.1 hypothetical protein GN958_ATG08791 [Phytophthora infestans]
MLSLRHCILLALAVSLTLQRNLVHGAECTDAEWQSSQSIWSWAATTSACARFAVGDSFVSAPCSATSCVSVMEQVGEQLPDCTVSGVNNKIEVQNAMTACNGEDLIETDAPFVLPPTAATLITIAPIVTSAPFQTLAPLSSLAPRPGGDSSGISGPATEPPASTDGSVDWSIGSSSSAGSGSTINCTNSEVSSLVSLYTETAKSSPCTSDATRTFYSITIFTKCASSCASKLPVTSPTAFTPTSLRIRRLHYNDRLRTAQSQASQATSARRYFYPQRHQTHRVHRASSVIVVGFMAIVML